MTKNDPAQATGVPNIVGIRLAQARESLGLTRGQAAERIGVSPGYWSDLESGRKTATLDKLWEYAGSLGVDPSSLDPRLASPDVETRAKAMARAMLRELIAAAEAAALERFGFDVPAQGADNDTLS